MKAWHGVFGFVLILLIGYFLGIYFPSFGLQVRSKIGV
jgi:hypothetical protein